MSFRIHFAVAAYLWLVALTATAQPATESARASLRDARLETFVAQALAGAPEMTSAEAALEAARRRIVPARTLADPSISTTYQNDGRPISFAESAGSFVGLMASQSIPWPGKLQLAGSIAESEAKEIERGTVGRTALTLEARVRNAWYDLILARAIDHIIEDRRVAAAQIEASVRERYAAGLAVQQDVLRAQVELARIDELKAVQAATIASRLAELNRLTGAPQDRGDLAGDLDVVAPDAGDLPKLPMTRAALQEGMRLYPSAHITERLTLEPMRLAGHEVPEQTIVAVANGDVDAGVTWADGLGMGPEAGKLRLLLLKDGPAPALVVRALTAEPTAGSRVDG